MNDDLTIEQLDRRAEQLIYEIKAANYGARQGQVIAGRLVRGQGGRFSSGGAAPSRSSAALVAEARRQARTLARQPKAPKGKGKGKGRAPKQTPEQRQTEKDQQKAQNRDKVFGKLQLDGDIQGSLLKLTNGDQPDGDVGGLVDSGLATKDSEGTYRLTPQGRALMAAASAGDAGRARDALSLGKDRAKAASDKAKRAQDRAAERHVRQVDRELQKQQREEEKARKEREKAAARSGGGGSSSKEPTAPRQTPEERAAEKEQQRSAEQAQNRQQVRDEMAADDVGLAPGGFDALMAFADGTELSDEAIAGGLAETGLVEQDTTGAYRLSTEGRQFVAAAGKGDKRGALDALSRALDKLAEQQAVDTEEPTMSGATKAERYGGKPRGELDDSDFVDQERRAFPIMSAQDVRDAVSSWGRYKGDMTFEQFKRRLTAIAKRKGFESALPDSWDVKSYFREGDDVHPGAMIALLLDDATREELLDAAELDDEDGIADHCTLIYLTPNAEDLDSLKNKLVARLADIAGDTTPVTGVVNGYGRFVGDDDDEGDALYANVDCPTLASFRQHLVMCLESCGVSFVANHGFTPHTTLTYLEADEGTPDLDIPKLPLTFDRFALVWAGETLTFPLLGAPEQADGAASLMQALGATPDGMPLENTVIYHGGEIKALGNGRIGGYLVRFGDATKTDMVGDFFTPETDFGSHKTSLVWYQHGMDGALQRRVLDPEAKLIKDNVGVWCEAQLKLRDAYEQHIYAMSEAGKMGWSSGTASHLVEREPVGKANWIKRWLLGLDASLTPTPCEPRAAAIPLKSYVPPDFPLGASPDTKSVSVPEIATETGRDQPVAGGSALKTLVTIYLTALEHDIKAQLEHWAGVRNHG